MTDEPKCPECGHTHPPGFPAKIVYVPLKENISKRYSLTCPKCEKGFIYPTVTDEEIYGEKKNGSHK
jgi:hypothetical protein